MTQQFKVEFYQKNNLTDGSYFIKNPADGSYLTYTGSTFPTFTGRDLLQIDNQLWDIKRDASSGRYKISSKANAAFFLDEYAHYNEGTYYPAWNTFNLYNLLGTHQYAIQNGGSAGTMFWKITNAKPRGKGSATLNGFPFEIIDPADDISELLVAPTIQVNGGSFRFIESESIEKVRTWY